MSDEAFSQRAFVYLPASVAADFAQSGIGPEGWLTCACLTVTSERRVQKRERERERERDMKAHEIGAEQKSKGRRAKEEEQ